MVTPARVGFPQDVKESKSISTSTIVIIVVVAVSPSSSIELGQAVNDANII